VKYDQNIYAPAAIMSRGNREKRIKNKENLGVQETMGPSGLGSVTCSPFSQSVQMCIHFMTLFFVYHRKLFFTIRSSEVQRNCN